MSIVMSLALTISITVTITIAILISNFRYSDHCQSIGSLSWRVMFMSSQYCRFG